MKHPALYLKRIGATGRPHSSTALNPVRLLVNRSAALTQFKAAWKGVAMKTQNYSNKLISKTRYNKLIADLTNKHFWLFKGKSVDLRPGWISLLDSTLEKIKDFLTEEEIKKLEFHYCFADARLDLIVEAKELSDYRRDVLKNLINIAKSNSEQLCAKCGCQISIRKINRSDSVCEEHEGFAGDFSEHYRRHLKLNKLDDDDNESDKLYDEDGESNAQPSNSGLQHVLYDVALVRKIKRSIFNRSADADIKNRLNVICQQLIDQGGHRPYCELPEPESINALELGFPNFSETLSTVRNAVALAKLGNGVLELPPLLLVGPPGVGKTQLANELAGTFSTGYLEIRMENEQNGSSITGSSEFWSNTQTGQIFEILTKGKTANPIVLLDEIDKVSEDTKYSPLGGLYGLLEKETAKRFEDQSFRGLKIDASAVIWILTANDISRIPAPIISRVMVQNIRPPTREESIVIAKSIYTSIRHGRPWGECFENELSTAVAERLSLLEPRQMKVSLLNGFGRAAIALRNKLLPEDIPDFRQGGRPIGFI